MPRTPATTPPNPFNIQESSHPLINVNSATQDNTIRADTYPASASSNDPRLTFSTRHGSTYIDERSLDQAIAVLMRYKSLLGDTVPETLEGAPLDEEAIEF